MTLRAAEQVQSEGVNLAAVHATALVIGETGLLMHGPSGAGKSSLALALINLAHARGQFARLIGDDRILLSVVHGRLVARPHARIAGQMEQRGRGIIAMDHEPAACIRARIDLVHPEPGRDIPPRLPSGADSFVTIGSMVLPRLMIPAGVSLETSARHVLAFLSGI